MTSSEASAVSSSDVGPPGRVHESPRRLGPIRGRRRRRRRTIGDRAIGDRPGSDGAGGGGAGSQRSRRRRRRPGRTEIGRGFRFGWGVVSVFVIESLILGTAALPAALFYQWNLRWNLTPSLLRGLLLGAAIVPAYLIFAHLLMMLSALTCRILGWRPKPSEVMPIAELGWPLIDWARYCVISHVVRLLAGTALRATPMWVWYLRLDGAQVGRRVWVNSLGITDHCLLRFDDGVVVGAGAHLSGHTVERGAVRTDRIHLGAGTVVGVNSIVGIGVTTGPGCQIGALSFVPKHSSLDADTTYVGTPARPVRREAQDTAAT